MLVNVITGYGPQFRFTLVFLRAEIDLGSQKYDFMTGKDIVTESYGAGLLMGKKVILGVHAEREACGQIEGPSHDPITGRITPGTARTSGDVLKYAPWNVGISLFNNLSFKKDDVKIAFGFKLYFSAEFSLNITELSRRISDHLISIQ